MKSKTSIVSWVALVVGLVALIIVGIAALSSGSQPAQLGGAYGVNIANPTFVAGADFGNYPVNYNWAAGKIGPKTNQAYWKNTSGATAYISSFLMATDGTASSSYTFYAYASTSPVSNLYNFTAPTGNGTINLITPFTIATSSAATTTPLANQIRVPANSYVNLLFQATNGTGCNGTTCETATSSNRGFNVPWRLEFNN